MTTEEQKKVGEAQHRMVGRLMGITDSLQKAVSELPHDERHARDLLAIARDATDKALIYLWGKAPEIPEQPK